MLERLVISAVYFRAATVLHRLGNCQRPEAGRAPCMPSARDVYWHRITYSWKTEEALARAAVTLETERTKRSNPSCLW